MSGRGKVRCATRRPREPRLGPLPRAGESVGLHAPRAGPPQPGLPANRPTGFTTGRTTSSTPAARLQGGKGLGKGGAKRHRKVLRDNIQGITKPAIRRLARRGGVKRISGLIYEETRGVLKVRPAPRRRPWPAMRRGVQDVPRRGPSGASRPMRPAPRLQQLPAWTCCHRASRATAPLPARPLCPGLTGGAFWSTPLAADSPSPGCGTRPPCPPPPAPTPLPPPPCPHPRAHP
jgi:hypothetical protein